MYDFEQIKLDIGTRYKAEQKGSKHQQKDIADAVQTTPTTLSRYVKGDRAPDMVFAHVIDQMGLDIYYIITGKRVDERGADLSDDEVELLEAYRQSADKKRLLAALKALQASE